MVYNVPLGIYVKEQNHSYYCVDVPTLAVSLTNQYQMPAIRLRPRTP